jgi:molybdopterin converting factor subunit 1
MKVNILYFASLRDSSKKAQEQIETEASTIDDVFNTLNEKYSFDVNKEDLKVAINEVYVDFTTTISENDTIVFIPPVAGG